MIDHEPELRRALDLLPTEVAPPPGLKARVRCALDDRLSAANDRRARLRLCFVALAALAFGVLVGVRIAPRTPSPADKGSVLSLRSARAILRPNTELVVDRDDPSGSSLRLVSGALLIHVQKGTGRSFEVLAGATRVQVVGTIFGVSRQAAEGVQVEVVEGVVRVSDANGERTLTAGQRWPASARVFEAASELAQLSAPLSVAASAPSAVAAEAMPVQAEPSAAAPSPPSPALSASASPGRAAEGDARVEAQLAYARAKSLERAGDARGALVAYVALAARASEVSEDALFSILRLHAAQGEHAAAQASVAQYRARFPNGRYARDVDVHALNLAVARADEASAQRECQAFLRRFPDDPRAWRFRLLQARERAAHGDCAQARELLERVPGSDAKQAIIAACSQP
ncbi:MAG TPA: FecR domain-containing protein [Polyangiaceae bacterium]